MGDTNPKNKQKLQGHKKKTGKEDGQKKLKKTKRDRSKNIKGSRTSR